MTKDRLIYRHRLWVRITHWINVVCMTVLLMSGLQIFNAHPVLYWGNASNFGNPLVAMFSRTG
jgi:cytochrome b subunit of formate dehydrogenase